MKPANGTPHVLVTGAHRSGTTWVGRTICRHPAMRYIGEPFNFGKGEFHTPRGIHLYFTHYDSFPAQAEIRAAMDLLLRGGRLRYTIGAIRRAGGHPRRQLRLLRRLLTEGVPRPRVLLKDPIALLSAGWLHETYGMKVVCMIRSPLAFVGSVRAADWDFEYKNFLQQDALMAGLFAPYRDEIVDLDHGRGDFIDRIATLWNLLHLAILDYRDRYPGWLFVPHEELVRSPLVGFRQIFDYCGLEMDEAIADHIREFTADGNPDEADSDRLQRRSPRGVIEAWRQRLSAEEIERISRITAPIADRLAQPDPAWPNTETKLGRV